MKLSTAFALAATSVVAAGCAAPALQPVPETLRPAGERFAMTVPARGVQIYECRARKDGGFEWTFVAPDAELFDAKARPIGRHGAGPFWQASDGSRVVGTLKARADAPQPGAVPWLLLTTKSAGPAGDFSRVTSIQRINTTGGIAPSAPCTEGLRGSTARVPYTADYIFFTSL
jgi:hypothetical protein